MDMETRKLQKVGGSTYSVSLPKEWATEHCLEAGTPIHLYPHTDGSLVVRSAEVDGRSLATATVSPPSPSAAAAARALRAAYAVGYDTVTLVPPADETWDDDVWRSIRRRVRTMVGTSVVEETDERVTVETLLDASEVSIRQSVTQLQFTALSIHAAALDRVERRAVGDTPSEVSETAALGGRDDEVDRLFAMLTRHFNRALADLGEVDALDTSRPELFDSYLVARQLERVADHAVRIGALTDRIDSTVGDDLLAEVLALAESARGVVESATTAAIEPSADLAHEALDRRDRVVEDARALDRALFERESTGAYALSRVLDSLVRTADCGGNVARVALRASVRPDA